MLATVLIACYFLSYPPFVTPWYISQTLRLSLEFALILPILAREIIADRKTLLPVVFLVVIAFKLVVTNDDAQFLLSRFDKVLFAVLLFSLLRNDENLLYRVRCILEVVLFVTAIQIWLAAVVWVFDSGAFVFDYFNVSEHADYGYSGHPVLGNVVPRSFGSFSLIRPMGFFMEPGMIASLLVFYSYAVSPWPLSSGLRGARNMLYWSAAVLTGSSSAVVLLLAIAVFRVTKRTYVAILIFVIAGIIVVSAISLVGQYIPSGTNRIGRMQSFVDVMRSSTIVSLVVGHTLGHGGSTEFGAINAGVAKLIVEFGVIMAFYLLRFLKRSIANVEAFVMALLVNLAFDFFWWPLFWVIVAAIRQGLPYNTVLRPASLEPAQ